MIDFCPVCKSALIPTAFEREGIVVGTGLGCPDLHYSKVMGFGYMAEIVDGEWFTCEMIAPKPEQVAWQSLINHAVFKACRKYKKGSLIARV